MDRRRLFEKESRLVNLKREHLMSNMNLISKRIIKRLIQDPMYENVTMNQIKKILNDNFITSEPVTTSNSIVLKNFITLRKGTMLDADNEETDTDTFKGIR
jgi:hypothetical protein